MTQYIDTRFLFKCETCRHCIDEYKCDTFCDSGECYSPNMTKIPPADVAQRSDIVSKICADIKKVSKAPHGYICLSIAELEKIKNKYTEGDI